MNPRFSIVVPTLDNFFDLKTLIASINAQTLLPNEIVIADSSSSNVSKQSFVGVLAVAPVKIDAGVSKLFIQLLFCGKDSGSENKNRIRIMYEDLIK